MQRGSIVNFRGLRWAVADLGFDPRGREMVRLIRPHDEALGECETCEG